MVSGSMQRKNTRHKERQHLRLLLRDMLEGFEVMYHQGDFEGCRVARRRIREIQLELQNTCRDPIVKQAVTYTTKRLPGD